jgi:hypothetical protein
MKFLRKLLINKTGIIFAVVHWILLLLTLPNLFSNLVDHPRSSEITWGIFAIPIIISDLPSLVVAAILWSPFYLFAEGKPIFGFGTFFTSLITITFQWLFIGKSISNRFSRTASKPMTLSLTDE